MPREPQSINKITRSAGEIFFHMENIDWFALAEKHKQDGTLSSKKPSKLITIKELLELTSSFLSLKDFRAFTAASKVFFALRCSECLADWQIFFSSPPHSLPLRDKAGNLIAQHDHLRLDQEAAFSIPDSEDFPANGSMMPFSFHSFDSKFEKNSPDNKIRLTFCRNSLGKLLDATTGAEIATLPSFKKHWLIQHPIFSLDSTKILTLSVKQDMYVLGGLISRASYRADLWDSKTGEKIISITLNCSKWSGPKAILSPDGKKILTTNGPNSKLWDSSTGSKITTLCHKEIDDTIRYVGRAVFSPDGTKIMTVSYGPSDDCAFAFVSLWNSETGKRIATLREHNVRSPDGFHYHRTSVRPVFSFDGTKILIRCANKDHSSRVWEIDGENNIQLRYAIHNSNGDRHYVRGSLLLFQLPKESRRAATAEAHAHDLTPVWM